MTYVECSAFGCEQLRLFVKRLISLKQELAAAPANLGFFLIDLPKLYLSSGWHKFLETAKM